MIHADHTRCYRKKGVPKRVQYRIEPEPLAWPAVERDAGHVAEELAGPGAGPARAGEDRHPEEDAGDLRHGPPACRERGEGEAD
eukprot:2609447-Rhodomonas_salina.1